MLGERCPLYIGTKFSAVKYSIMCVVLSKTSSDSCIVYLTVINNNCCLNWFNDLQVKTTFSRMLCVAWYELDCSDRSKPMFGILLICVRDNASATTFVVPGFYIIFGVQIFISTIGFLSETVKHKDWWSVCISMPITLCNNSLYPLLVE